MAKHLYKPTAEEKTNKIMATIVGIGEALLLCSIIVQIIK